MKKLDIGLASNEKIEELGIRDLQKYACPKISGNKDWYLSCVSCQGMCKVGRRVNEILDKETSSTKSQIEKFNERMAKATSMGAEVDKRVSNYKKHGVEIHNAARHRINSVFRDTPNPDEIIRRLYNLNPNSKCCTLSAKLYVWNTNNPDICKNPEDIKMAAKLLERFNRTHPGALVKDYIEATSKKEEVSMENGNNHDEVSIEEFLSDAESLCIETPSKNEEIAIGCADNSDEESAEKFLNDSESHHAVTRASDAAASAETAIGVAEIEDINKYHLRMSFAKKKEELGKRITYIDGEILKMTSLRESIKKQIVNLEEAEKIFGLS